MHVATADRPLSEESFVPKDSVCPAPSQGNAAQKRPGALGGRLVPLGSVCPAPAEGAELAHARAVERSLHLGGSVVPLGITCPELSRDTAISHAAALDQTLGIGGRLVPTGSTCHVLAHGTPREILSAPTFAKSFLSTNRMPGRSRRSTVAWSVAVHTVLLAVVVVVPMWFTNTMDLRSFTQTMLVATSPPMAPAAPPVPAEAVARPTARPTTRRDFVIEGRLQAPRTIPKAVAKISEAPLPPETPAGAVFGGLPSSLMSGIFDTAAAAPPPPPLPPPEAPKQPLKPETPLRVGGDVKPPQLVHSVSPVYPVLARQARIEGDVVLSAIIDVRGTVVDLKAVDGPALLYQAALDAVSKWKFEPTYLNGQAWPVSYEITVHFRL